MNGIFDQPTPRIPRRSSRSTDRQSDQGTVDDELPPLKAMKMDNCSKSNVEFHDFEMNLGQEEETMNPSSSGNDIVKLEIPEDFSETEEIEEIEFEESFSGQGSTDGTVCPSCTNLDERIENLRPSVWSVY